MPPSNLVSVERDLRFCSKLMQNDDLREPIGLLMMHVKGCLNLRSSNMTDHLVYPTPLLNISEWKGRIVTEVPSLKERDSIDLLFGLCHDMYLTVSSLALYLELGMNCYCFRIVLS